MSKFTKISMFASNDDNIDFEFQTTFNDAIDIKHGDIFKLGNHYLMCGDATNIDDLKRLMGDKKADMLLTDPPYNVDYKGGTVDELTISNDNLSDSVFRLFLKDAFSNVFKYLKEGGSYYIFHASSESYNFIGALLDNNIILRQILIWVKNTLVLGRQDYHWQHEPILYGWKCGASHKWYSDRRQTTTLFFDKPLRNELHPTIKPLDLLIYLIGNSTKKGDIIVDTFGGSGTTLIASELTGRYSYLMELSPSYCNVIINNYTRLTGIKPVKISEEKL